MTMEQDDNRATMTARANRPEGCAMVGHELWAELRRVHEQEGLSVTALAQRFDLDRKTVRGFLQATAWQPYPRAGADRHAAG